MKKIVVLLTAIVFFFALKAQDLQKQLQGKTFHRTFYALGFKHQAWYTFKENKVIYRVQGFFVTDSYEMIGQYQSSRFVGIDPQSKQHYVINIKILSPQKILISKQGVDPKYKTILTDKPVKGWHEYELKRSKN